ncbi:MAG TPA: pseudouridine synthase [Phycisphaerae bacterium]|nr:pseudouridine synthase [Phycisphaerae bacterium]HRW53075.1 pseudouridine synthase [Phycisphaerae bacterium]
MPKQRIQKVLAAAGFGSRRACEQLVEDGRVTVDGRVVEQLPVVVDLAVNRVTVDDKPIRVQKFVYFVLNKPKGYFCTNSDPDGRRRAVDLMVGVRERVFPVGRLDAESMGLLIMTNDGDLALKLTHPRFQTPKTYRAEVRGQPDTESLDKLRKGVWLAEGRTGPADIAVIHSSRKKSVLEITLREGRNREIRRMLARFGYPVTRLTRIKMGRISIRKLPQGSYRPLSEDEVKYLYRLAEGLETGEVELATGAKKTGAKRVARGRGGSSRLGGRSSNIRGRRNAGKKKRVRRDVEEVGATTEKRGTTKKSSRKGDQAPPKDKKRTKAPAKKVARAPAKKVAKAPAKKAAKAGPKRRDAQQQQEREAAIIPRGANKKRRIIFTD